VLYIVQSSHLAAGVLIYDLLIYLYTATNCGLGTGLDLYILVLSVQHLTSECIRLLRPLVVAVKYPLLRHIITIIILIKSGKMAHKHTNKTTERRTEKKDQERHSTHCIQYKMHNKIQ